MRYQQVAVLIPAYKPDGRLVTLVDALMAAGFARIVAVDDGGGPAYADIFEQLRGKAEVLTHEVNRGKGAALKTGLRHLMATPGIAVVTADADGQHTPEDCVRIADALIAHPGALVLGTRDKKQMPPRSRAGNTLTCGVFGLVTGLWVSDTQTGLRGLPADSLPRFAGLSGDRYEYELSVLMDARHRRMAVVEVPIETVYLDQKNSSSHFHALRDGLRIYALLFREVGAFMGSSLLCTLVDYSLFILLDRVLPGHMAVALPGHLRVGRQGAQVLGARAVSATLNYALNRRVVFRRGRGLRSAAMYYALAALIAVCSWQGIALLTSLGMQQLLAKGIVDALLFLVNYQMQQRVVFRGHRKKA
ncbi:MAG: glycosyltransferase family 2 protein [Clostridiales bacterium]|nr:glycosyltransferase family 2 protein [Clostridiales bacterium]